MLQHARAHALRASPRPVMHLARSFAERLPFDGASFDLVVCALVAGHVVDLAALVGELTRVLRPGGQLLMSDMHPIGATLGWRRTFDAGGDRLAVRFTAHSLAAWRTACDTHGLEIAALLEPRLLPEDIPAGASVDPATRDAPVALVLDARRHRGRKSDVGSRR
jgi:malonyl-CoA O-methyltransferase